jgi:hypothetical protein
MASLLPSLAWLTPLRTKPRPQLQCRRDGIKLRRQANYHHENPG